MQLAPIIQYAVPHRLFRLHRGFLRVSKRRVAAGHYAAFATEIGNQGDRTCTAGDGVRADEVSAATASRAHAVNMPKSVPEARTWARYCAEIRKGLTFWAVARAAGWRACAIALLLADVPAAPMCMCAADKGNEAAVEPRNAMRGYAIATNGSFVQAGCDKQLR